MTFSPNGSGVAHASASDLRTVDIQAIFKIYICNLQVDLGGIQSLDIPPKKKKADHHFISRVVLWFASGLPLNGLPFSAPAMVCILYDMLYIII